MTNINPNSRASFVDSEGKLTKYGQDMFREINDLIGNTGDASSAIQDIIGQVFSVISAGKNELNTVTVTGSYTSYGNEFLNVTGSHAITLNPSPNDGEKCIVYHAGSNGDVVSVTDGTGTDYIYLPETLVSYEFDVNLNKYVRGL